MPIWVELIILMLFTYALGLALGWLLWGRMPSEPVAVEAAEDIEGDKSP